MAAFKLQSAMEYLMTYGWAILIIAVVLGALFALGFFNSANLAPKVPGGGCEVYRPNGPGTTTYLNTEGTCNNGLPQVVAQFAGVSTANIVISNLQSSTSGTGNTITFWVNGKGANAGTAVSLGTAANNNVGFGATCFGVGGTYGVLASTVANTFNFVAVTFNGVAGGATIYLNGQSITAATGCNTAAALASATSLYIGSNSNAQAFNGMVSNIQLYNASLTANEIYGLYIEGIGGVPVSLQYLIGWWPLNGNANDYSGDLHNGVSTGVTYTTAWASTYSAP